MAADVTQSVQIIELDDGFRDLPAPVQCLFGISLPVIDLKAMESGGDAGGDTGGGGSTRPTTGMLYPRA